MQIQYINKGKKVQLKLSQRLNGRMFYRKISGYNNDKWKNMQPP